MKIEYNNKLYEIEIIKKNNKNLYIRIKENKVVITCNYFTSKKEIERIIKNNYKTITKMIEKKEKQQEKNKKFFLFGKEYRIIYDLNSELEIEDNIIIAKNEKFLEKWLDKYIYQTFFNHLEYWLDKYEEKIPNPNLKIRKMKTRWGVCNTKNHNVTLNRELYRYDIKCLDYVIIHELSHFIEPNHSSDFWIQVSKYCPNYKEIRKILND